MIRQTLPTSSIDPYAGPDSFTAHGVSRRAPQARPIPDREGNAQPSTTVGMHRVPPHCLVGCKIRLMAKAAPAEPTAPADRANVPAAAITGVVRFFDQYGLLGVAAADPDSGIATLPYAFTSGGRRELRAEYSGCPAWGVSRSSTTSIRIYSAAATIALDDVPSQPYVRG